ncbi:MAG: DNA primase, partial [Proteobacteria bacterium]
MGIVAQESIEEIKEKANLVDIIGEAVSLKRRGSSYVGLCPFHAEKTPSFHVREEKFYHCFGCGESGNVISFVMRFRGLSFPEAIEELAGRCGVQLKFEKSGRKNVPLADKQALFKVNALALAWFSAQLKSAPPQVKDYINSRSLTREALAAFAIGFAPKEWSALTTFLRARKVPDEMILRCGLARRSPKGDLFDVFRARIIFPIFSDSKRVAAFGGRIIPELLEKEALNQAPKYLNSPESPIYFKSKVLFGLPQALSAIQQEREVWIVEGYMDVIGMWQAGIRNAVATCGTALTSEHAKRLKLLVKKVILLFDGDDAGRGAAGKAYDAFLNSGIDVCAAFLPQGEDPDSFVGKEAGAGAI